MVRRLAHGGELHLHLRDKRIQFRHCVVSDYGLWVARHVINQSQMQSTVDIWLGDRQRFVRVLRPDLDAETIRSRWDLSPKDFDEWLSENVNPLAFQNAKLWRGRQLEAQEFCEKIGIQLIERYTTEQGKDWSDKVKRGFAIGAGRFGSSLMFAHSVPKVCLPVFWLGGAVQIDSTAIDWQPLFYDARRA